MRMFKHCLAWAACVVVWWFCFFFACVWDASGDQYTDLLQEIVDCNTSGTETTAGILEYLNYYLSQLNSNLGSGNANSTLGSMNDYLSYLNFYVSSMHNWNAGNLDLGTIISSFQGGIGGLAFYLPGMDHGISSISLDVGAILARMGAASSNSSHVIVDNTHTNPVPVWVDNWHMLLSGFSNMNLQCTIPDQTPAVRAGIGQANTDLANSFDTNYLANPSDDIAVTNVFRGYNGENNCLWTDPPDGYEDQHQELTFTSGSLGLGIQMKNFAKTVGVSAIFDDAAGMPSSVLHTIPSAWTSSNMWLSSTSPASWQAVSLATNGRPVSVTNFYVLGDSGTSWGGSSSPWYDSFTRGLMSFERDSTKMILDNLYDFIQLPGVTRNQYWYFTANNYINAGVYGTVADGQHVIDMSVVCGDGVFTRSFSAWISALVCAWQLWVVWIWIHNPLR